MRKKITSTLTEMLRHYLNPNNDSRIYIAREVTFDYGRPGQCRVDYMRFVPLNNSVSGIEKGDVYCYEIKSCPEDFASSNGHNLIGDYNYYVMPREVYEKVRDSISFTTGVLCPEKGALKAFKKARRTDRDKPIPEILLMMFRSANREIINRQIKEERENESPDHKSPEPGWS